MSFRTLLIAFALVALPARAEMTPIATFFATTTVTSFPTAAPTAFPTATATAVPTATGPQSPCGGSVQGKGSASYAQDFGGNRQGQVVALARQRAQQDLNQRLQTEPFAACNACDQSPVIGPQRLGIEGWTPLVRLFGRPADGWYTIYEADFDCE